MNAIKQSDNHQVPILVVGLGKTGWSVVRFLCDQKLPVVVTDTREIPPFLSEMRAHYPDIEFVPAMAEEQYSQFSEVIVSPGVAVSADNTVGDIELFLREAAAPVIAITGSNGKSTVTMLVTEMLEAGGYKVLTGGNIGTPALDLLAQPSPDFYVLELSSFQLETTYSLRAVASVVLNISEDHMDRYNDLHAYANAKRRIYDNARTIVTNRQDAVAAGGIPAKNNTESLSFGLDQPDIGHYGIAVRHGSRFLAYGDRLLAPISQVVMGGEQNCVNILSALALISGAGIEVTDQIVAAGTSYPGLPHRCEVIAEHRKVTWVNDSKGTNVGATLAAIEGAAKPVILIAGGQGKGADFSRLGMMIDANCKAAILIGEDAKEITATIKRTEIVHQAESLEQAIEKAADLAGTGDTVLFSPACASFDMFNSYEHRGDRFREIVTELVQEDLYAG